MECKLRKWRSKDAKELVVIINNKKVQDNLRDGIPYPYTLDDAEFFINEMLMADPGEVYAFAHNTASCHILEKNGFQYEGTLKSNAVKNEAILDMIMYARIKE